MVQESIESALTRRIQALEEEVRALRTGIPRMGELIGLSEDGSIGTLRVWNQYGEHQEDRVRINPGGDDSALYSRVVKGISSEVVTAFMKAGGAWGTNAVDYIRPTVRVEQTPLSDELDALSAATGTALDTIGNREGVNRAGQSDSAYRTAILNAIGRREGVLRATGQSDSDYIESIKRADDTQEFIRGEICLVVSVPPYNIAIPGVMTKHEDISPIREITGATIFTATPEAFGQGSVRISGGGLIEGIGGRTGVEPMVVRFTSSGIEAQVQGNSAIVAMPKRTDKDGNPLVGSDDIESDGFDAVEVQNIRYHGTYTGIGGRILRWLGSGASNVIRLATKFYLDGAITSWRYAQFLSADDDSALGEFSASTNIDNTNPANRRIAIPRANAANGVIISLTLFNISNSVQIQRSGSTAREEVTYSSIEMREQDFPATLYVAGNSGNVLQYQVVLT